jgi:hypothetical protein
MLHEMLDAPDDECQAIATRPEPRTRRRVACSGQTTLTIPYPWVAGEPHHIKVVTSSGTIEWSWHPLFAPPGELLRTRPAFD